MQDDFLPCFMLNKVNMKKKKDTQLVKKRGNSIRWCGRGDRCGKECIVRRKVALAVTCVCSTDF